MESDFAIVDLPPDLAARCGTDRVLVEAVELDGGALLRGVAREWFVVDGVYHVPQGAWLKVPDEHHVTLERLFEAARKQQRGPDYIDVRHGPTKSASRPDRPSAPVRYTPGRRTW